MARVIYGSIITDIKGSIGGITFQKNGSGQIARLKPRKIKTNTQAQRNQQPRLKEVQREWNKLSLANKILWNDFASVNDKIGLDGQAKKLTGYQWFLTINENRLLFEDSILSTPPTYEIVNPIDSITLQWDQINLDIVTNVSLGGVENRVLVYCSFIENSASKVGLNKTRLVRLGTAAFSNKVRVNGISPANYWEEYYNSSFPPSLANKPFYLIAYIKIIGLTSGISSLAYTTIAKFVWDGSKYIIE